MEKEGKSAKSVQGCNPLVIINVAVTDGFNRFPARLKLFFVLFITSFSILLGLQVAL